jgi:hypothetical protein
MALLNMAFLGMAFRLDVVALFVRMRGTKVQLYANLSKRLNSAPIDIHSSSTSRKKPIHVVQKLTTLSFYPTCRINR